MTRAAAIVTVSLNPAIDRIIEVPGLALGEHKVGRLVTRLPAGKAVNVSRALAILGAPSVATGFVGREELAMFERSLDPAAIRSDFIPVHGSTRENITLVDPLAHRETHVRDVGFEVREADRAILREKLSKLCAPGVMVVFAGSLPQGVTAADFASLVQDCIEAGANVAVDTSGEALLAAARLPLWLIKPNEVELSEVSQASVSTEAQLLDAGRRLAARIRNVVVSRGREGVVCFAGSSVWKGRVDISPDRVRNTVGCGDCLLAGYLAATLQGGDAAEACRCALAAATASAVSVESSRFNMQDVVAFLSQAFVDAVPLRGEP